MEAEQSLTTAFSVSRCAPGAEQHACVGRKAVLFSVVFAFRWIRESNELAPDTGDSLNGGRVLRLLLAILRATGGWLGRRCSFQCPASFCVSRLCLSVTYNPTACDKPKMRLRLRYGVLNRNPGSGNPSGFAGNSISYSKHRQIALLCWRESGWS